MKTIENARVRSERGIKVIRELASGVFGRSTNLIIGANGSYARREATDGSDIDLFYLLAEQAQLDSQKREVFERELEEQKFKLPATGGVFQDALRVEELLSNIGGEDDTNTCLTRRLLLLLEGEWLLNESGFRDAKSQLVHRYVTDSTPSDKISLFLLNDIIRYWRTICVDYEYKTSDGKKPRGIRLVKLRFSRMFLVFGGIIAVAETMGLAAEEKRRRLGELFALDVHRRVESIMGRNAEKSFLLYEKFLSALDDASTRQCLSSPGYEKTKIFAELRSWGREFKDELIVLLQEKYVHSHPIHKALLL